MNTRFKNISQHFFLNSRISNYWQNCFFFFWKYEEVEKNYTIEIFEEIS